MVNAAVLPAESFNFVRNVAEVREVLMRPVELLFTAFTNVMLREPDLPAIEHVALRALETVYDSFLLVEEVVDSVDEVVDLVGAAVDLNRRDSEDFGLATELANFNTGRL
jgi:hypothetical protein